MRKNLLLVLLMFFSPAQAQSSQEHWRLLISGDYHGDEAPTKPGIGWLALIPLGGVWRLEPALVRAKPVFDVVLDAKGQTTGIQITSIGQMPLPCCVFKTSNRARSIRRA